MDKLSKDARKAREMGLSYGKYKALEWEATVEARAKAERAAREARERQASEAEERRKRQAELDALAREAILAKWKDGYWEDRVCAVCGGKMQHARTRYCSEECRQKARKEMAKEWHQRRKNGETSVKVPNGLQCRICGKALVASQQSYCSKVCAEEGTKRVNEAYRQRKRAKGH